MLLVFSGFFLGFGTLSAIMTLWKRWTRRHRWLRWNLSEPSVLTVFLSDYNKCGRLGFGTLEEIVSKIPSGGSLGFGHDSVSGAIILE